MKPAGRAKVSSDDHLPLAVGFRVEGVDQRISHRRGKEVQGLFVHGAGLARFLLTRALQSPGKGVEGPLRSSRISFQAFFQQADNGALGRTHGSVEQENPSLGPVVPGCRLENVHQMHQGPVQAEDRVEASVERVGKEPVPKEFVFILHVSLGPVGNNEIVDPLEGIAKDFRTVSQDLEVIFERPFPMKVLVGTVLGVSIDEGSDFLLSEHGFTSGSEAPTD